MPPTTVPFQSPQKTFVKKVLQGSGTGDWVGALKAFDPSETVILIEATYQAKPPKDRIMRVPMRIPLIPSLGKLLFSLTALIMTSSSQKKKQLPKHNRSIAQRLPSFTVQEFDVSIMVVVELITDNWC